MPRVSPRLQAKREKRLLMQELENLKQFIDENDDDVDEERMKQRVLAQQEALLAQARERVARDRRDREMAERLRREGEMERERERLARVQAGVRDAHQRSERERAERAAAERERAEREREERERGRRREEEHRNRGADAHVGHCIICWEDEPNYALIPCGHIVFCQPCARSARAAPYNCPVCRVPTTGQLHVYRA